MGTRGAWGISVDGELRFMAYNHSDSYPDGLGLDLADAIVGLSESHGLDWARAKARVLRKVDETMTPTAEDIERCKPYTDLGVSRQSTGDWYCLLRREVMEVYRGFQKHAHEIGRFAAMKQHDPGPYSKNYYPVRLVHEVPFRQLSDKPVWLAAVRKAADGEEGE